MKVRLLFDLPTPNGVIPSGRIINVPDHVVERLYGKVIPLPRHRHDTAVDWQPAPQAWLQDGELRTTGVFPDLADEIVKLTDNDLPLQRRLLLEHCDLYGPHHLWILAKTWKDRVESLRVAQRLSERDAEAQAAKEMSLMAWLPELRKCTIH